MIDRALIDSLKVQVLNGDLDARHVLADHYEENGDEQAAKWRDYNRWMAELVPCSVLAWRFYGRGHTSRIPRGMFLDDEVYPVDYQKSDYYLGLPRLPAVGADVDPPEGVTPLFVIDAIHQTARAIPRRWAVRSYGLGSYLEINSPGGPFTAVIKAYHDALALEAEFPQRIENFGLSTRVTNCLTRWGLSLIAHLLVRTDEDLLKMPGFGERALSEVNDALESCGLRLGQCR